MLARPRAVVVGASVALALAGALCLGLGAPGLVVPREEPAARERTPGAAGEGMVARRGRSPGRRLPVPALPEQGLPCDIGGYGEVGDEVCEAFPCEGETAYLPDGTHAQFDVGDHGRLSLRASGDLCRVELFSVAWLEVSVDGPAEGQSYFLEGVGDSAREMPVGFILVEIMEPVLVSVRVHAGGWTATGDAVSVVPVPGEVVRLDFAAPEALRAYSADEIAVLEKQVADFDRMEGSAILGGILGNTSDVHRQRLEEAREVAAGSGER